MVLDVKGDKGLWLKYNLEHVGMVLAVEESYYDCIVELIENQQKEIKNLQEIIRDLKSEINK